MLLIIIAGLIFTTSGKDSVPHIANEGVIKGSGILGAFLVATLSAFWAYNGFTGVTFLTGEIKNPKKNVPLAIVIGVGIVIVLYLLINYVFLKVASAHELGQLSENTIAASYVAGKIAGTTGSTVISWLVMLSCFGSLNLGLLYTSRMLYRMAQENAFFKNAAKVHPVYKTPYIAMYYFLGWSSVLFILGTFDLLSDMVTLLEFLCFAVLAAGLIKLKMNKILEAKIPGYPWVPILFILFVLAVSVNTFLTQPILSLAGFGLVATGIPFYLYYKKSIKSKQLMMNENFSKEISH